MLVGVKNIQSLSDDELIGKYKKTGDNSFVGELYKRYTHFVFCVCLKYFKNEDDSKEAVMQIFEKLLADLKTHNIEKFKPWLHVVTRNHCRLALRSEKYRQKFEDGYKNHQEVFMENNNHLYPDSEDDTEIKLELLGDAIKQLNNEQRKCIELFYLQDKSYNDVAEITGYDLLKVKSYIQNGKRNLKILMTKENE